MRQSHPFLRTRYFSNDNFLGKRMYAYFHPTCILTEEAAKQLSAANVAAMKDGYTLKVYDCFRPQRTVDYLERWKDNNDTKTKAEYYPDLSKAMIFSEGYLGQNSSHSRGSTVAVTLVRSSMKGIVTNTTKDACHLPNRARDNSVDMATNFDCFHKLSHIDAVISAEQKQNRQRLTNLLQGHGFRVHPKKWWQFTLILEPFTDKYFDFVVQ